MKTLLHKLRRRRPSSLLADHLRFFNAPRIYLPDLSIGWHAKNRTLPHGNLRLRREENSGTT